MQQLICPIRATQSLNANTRQVLLDLPDGYQLDFKAGQYLNIVIGDKRCPFSIASSPDCTDHLELHIRPTPGSNESVTIDKLLDNGSPLTIELPGGDCYVDTLPAQTLVLLAASTGFTQMKSIIEFLLPRQPVAPVVLYWGAVTAQDLYYADQCNRWQTDFAQFEFVPVVSEPASSPQWQGRTGLVPKAVLEDFSDLRDVSVITSGSPGMVYASLDAFVARGMPAGNMSSDVFSYAPRT